MKTYTFIYSETAKQVWGMILAPLLLTAIYIVVLFEMGFDKYIPLWLSVAIFIGAIVFSMLWLFKKALAVPATVSFGYGSLTVVLNKRTFLLRERQFTVAVETLKSFSADRNPQAADRYYFTITTRDPSRSFTLTQDKAMTDADAEAFRQEGHDQIEHFNQTVPPQTRIREGSFFDAPWAKGLTWFVYAALAASTIAYAGGAPISGLKLVQLYCFSLGWLGSYYAGRGRSNRARMSS